MYQPNAHGQISYWGNDACDASYAAPDMKLQPEAEDVRALKHRILRDDRSKTHVGLKVLVALAV